jgi:hypothetical protein
MPNLSDTTVELAAIDRLPITDELGLKILRVNKFVWKAWELRNISQILTRNNLGKRVWISAGEEWNHPTTGEIVMKRVELLGKADPEKAMYSTVSPYGTPVTHAFVLQMSGVTFHTEVRGLKAGTPAWIYRWGTILYRIEFGPQNINPINVH